MAYSIIEKLQIVDQIRQGKTQANVVKNWASPSLRGWLKDENKLREACSTIDDCGQARKRGRTAQDQQL